MAKYHANTDVLSHTLAALAAIRRSQPSLIESITVVIAELVIRSGSSTVSLSLARNPFSAVVAAVKAFYLRRIQKLHLLALLAAAVNGDMAAP